MKALVKKKNGYGNVDLLDVPIPKPAPDELQIKVKYCGICGTDIHVHDDEFPNCPPVILGHEFSGTISAIGDRVPTNWSIGEQVVAECNIGSCGKCYFCSSGKPHICYDKTPIGSKSNGAFAEFIGLPASLVHRVPAGVPMEVASLSEPFAVVAHGFTERYSFVRGSNVLITGCGTIGLMSVIWAKRLGAKSIIVAGIKKDELERFSLALELGASAFVNVETDCLDKAVKRNLKGSGVDLLVECSGASNVLLSIINSVKKTGNVILIGLSGPPDIPFPLNTAVLNELTFYGSYSATPNCWKNTLEVEKSESSNLFKLITSVLPLKEWKKGFKMMRKGEGIKILIDMEA